MFSPICFTNHSTKVRQFEQLKKKTNFLSVKNSLQVDKKSQNKYSLKKFVYSKFKIGETIWWIRYRTRLVASVNFTSALLRPSTQEIAGSKVIIEKSRNEVSLMKQATIENVS